MVGHLPPGQYPRQSFERVLENTLVESEDDLSSTPDHFAEAECQIRPVLDRHPAEHATFYFPMLIPDLRRRAADGARYPPRGRPDAAGTKQAEADSGRVFGYRVKRTIRQRATLEE
jgi:hypothetical protein